MKTNHAVYMRRILCVYIAAFALSTAPRPAFAYPGMRGSPATDVLDVGRDIRKVTSEVSLVMTGFGQIEAAKYAAAESCFKTGFLNGEKTGNSFLQGLAMLGFGRLYSAKGRYASSLESFDRAIQLFTTETGKQKRLLARAYSGKAELLLDTGKPGDAAAALAAAYDIVKSDMDTPLRSDVIYGRARLFFFLGNYERARVLHTRVKNQRAKILGPRDPAVAQSCLRLGEILQLTKRFDLARDFFYEAVNIYENAYGKENPHTAEAYFSIGKISADSGDFPAALLFLQRAMDIQEKILDRQHPAHAATSAELGRLYLATDLYDNAKNALFHAIDADTAAFGENSLQAARDEIYLGEIYLERMELHSAVDNLKTALCIQRVILGDKHPDLARTLNSLAAAYYYSAEYNNAFSAQREALKIDLETIEPFNDEDAEIADFNNLGALAMKTGDPRAAVEHYLAAINIEKLKPGANPLRMASLQHNLAEAYEKLGDDSPSLAAYHESLKLMRWFLGLETPSTAANYVAPLDNRGAGDKYVATEGNQFVAEEFLRVADIQLRLNNLDEAEKAYKSFLRLTYPKDDRADRVINILKLTGRWYDPEESQKAYLPLSKPDNK